jgi:hypothetical protein
VSRPVDKLLTSKGNEKPEEVVESFGGKCRGFIYVTLDERSIKSSHVSFVFEPVVHQNRSIHTLPVSRLRRPFIGLGGCTLAIWYELFVTSNELLRSFVWIT